MALLAYCEILIYILFQLTLVIAAPEPSCIESSDAQLSDSAHSDTLAAGARLLAFLNDPTREGRLSLPAQGISSTYEVARESGTQTET